MTTKDAEQRAKARRIAENAGEEEESKKREKLQWMYTQKENDEEDYLLGKAVKDDLDFCRQEEKRVEDSFGSLYAQRDSASALQVDMGAKLREDPMAYIKKSDDDAWRKIYENPVKMALLRTILRPMMEKRKRKAKKLKGGGKATAKTMKKTKKAEKSDAESSSASSSSSESEAEDEDAEMGRRKHGSGTRHSPEQKPGTSASFQSGLNRPYGLSSKDSGRSERVQTHSSSSSPSNGDRTYKFIERRKLEKEKKEILKGKSVVSSKERKKVLSQEEMEERRRQMMEDAKANNKERSGNVKKYKEEEKRETLAERDSRDKAGHFAESTQPDFVRPLVNEAYKSAEERIKRNINSIQRSRADQDKNFTKR